MTVLMLQLGTLVLNWDHAASTSTISKLDPFDPQLRSTLKRRLCAVSMCKSSIAFGKFRQAIFALCLLAFALDVDSNQTNVCVELHDSLTLLG